MAELALEYIVKIIILLVVAGVIIGLILIFQGNIYNWWKGFSSPTTTLPGAEVIERSSFTAAEIANFIEGCWSTHAGSTSDDECYFLLGDLSGITKVDILASISSNIISPDKVIFEFDTLQNALAITYDNYRSEAQSEAIVLKG